VSAVQSIAVVDGEAELRLDRWFKRHFPELSHGRLEKLLRTGQVRVDGKRAAAGDRLAPGQLIRVPPLAPGAPRPGRPPAARPATDDREAAALRRLVLHRDDDVIVIDKPAGLAVQGGSGTIHHLDGMLDALRFDSTERPRLVHRLDRDTSGVLLLARHAAAARALAEAFREKTSEKTYWAVVVGVPTPRTGKIDAALAKRVGFGRERVALDDEDGQSAVTLYRILDKAGRRAAWLELKPVTGRTHQLRVHCLALGTPILGDGKYGGAAAFLAGAELPRQLHLHARAIKLPHPSGGLLEVTADLPPHLRETFGYFGFAAPAARR
jgi:23S rRNA pseudouridine955/2504/2580 synthase